MLPVAQNGLTRVPAGLPGAGRVRLVDVEKGRFIAASHETPRKLFGQAPHGGPERHLWP